MLYPAELPGHNLVEYITVWQWIGGAEEDRTPDLCIANAALSQLSYGPTQGRSLASAPTLANGATQPSRAGDGKPIWLP